ncbi:hypothetical protein ACW6QP_02790 [Salegentibacter sp. HM20]
MKKFFVLAVLFILPILAYLFFASGENNFARLPVLSENVQDIAPIADSLSFSDKISIVAFFGRDLQQIKGNTFNLDKKILEKYYEFNDFQFIILLPEGMEAEAEAFAEEFKNVAGTEYWNFVYASEEEIGEIFSGLKTPHRLDENLYSPYVFIVDKELKLRGRDDDEDYGKVYGYDSRSVADLSNKMNDDVKVVLAEYRLALKKNSADRKN